MYVYNEKGKWAQGEKWRRLCGRMRRREGCCSSKTWSIGRKLIASGNIKERKEEGSGGNSAEEGVR